MPRHEFRQCSKYTIGPIGGILLRVTGRRPRHRHWPYEIGDPVASGIDQDRLDRAGSDIDSDQTAAAPRSLVLQIYAGRRPRQFRGEVPCTRLNSLLKYPGSLTPTRLATSATGRSVSSAKCELRSCDVR